MDALEEFADCMVTRFFLPRAFMMSPTCNHFLTQAVQLGPHPSKHRNRRPPRCLQIQASTATGIKQRLSVLRHDCLVRDHHRCVVTRKFDITEARRRHARDENCTDDDGKPLKEEQRDNFQYLEVAHILPHCLTKVASGDKDLTESKKNVLRILDMFDPGITHLIDGPKIDSPSNALTLTLDNHRLFGEFQIYFEPTGRTYEYTIHSVESGFLSDPFFPVTRTLTLSPNHTIDPPSHRLLGIHRAISLILKLSAADAYIEQTLRNLEQITVEADGSTHLGDIMGLRLGGWINQLAVF
ncbi:hypothetical protein ACJ73_01784 [Blastomyces percursus]|uniref:HNH nuclease domain-containing protein n=1 Tax=Blastomyces percursus TaxID=1658174 RepID=A0A1J9QE67_9EURO|nr:hypothetical protein ACJ73_01784 [Blastomyces percursus]